MIDQLEFEAILGELTGGGERVAVKLPRPKVGMNTQTYAIGLARALRRENLAHAVFNVLSVVAREQALHGFATVPKVVETLGITFNAVQVHMHRNAHLFHIQKREHRRPVFHMLTLSDEAIALLVKIQKSAKLYAKQIA